MGGGGFSGGGFGGGGYSRPSMGHNPGFSSPRPSYPSGGGFNSGGFSRPNTGAMGGGNFNRPNLGANSIGSRPQIPNNIQNRPGVGNMGVGNRPAIGGGNNIVNRPGGNNFVNRPGGNTFNNVNINNVRNNNFVGNNNWAGRYPYNGYHQNWMHGSWNYHYPNYNWGYFGGGFIAGMSTWALASSLTGWGYYPYMNPYYGGYGYGGGSTVVVQQPVVVAGQPMQAQSAYNYSQPINTMSAPPEESTANAAVAIFDQAREAFKAGDYATALKQTDAALAQMPNDPTLHEFRALTLFAQKQYDPAAAGLYAVLTAGPGWDWTTMVGLYPNVDVYTGQLRALEEYTLANPKSASAKFVLAYHYLTEGFPDNAAGQLREVVKLQPADTLSAKLLAGLEAKNAGATAANTSAATSDVPPADPTPAVPLANAVPAGSIVGTWTAKPIATTTINLTVAADGKFSWDVNDQSGKRSLAGSSTFGENLLTLAPTTGEPLVGKITWKDANSFTFQAGGGGANDPGLAFSKVN